MVRYLGDRVEEDGAPRKVEVDDDPPLSQLRFGMMMILNEVELVKASRAIW